MSETRDWPVLYERLLDERAADYAKWFKIINFGGLTEYQAECPQIIDLALRELVLWRWLADMRLTVQENSDINSPAWAVRDVDNEIHGVGETAIDAVRHAHDWFYRPVPPQTEAKQMIETKHTPGPWEWWVEDTGVVTCLIGPEESVNGRGVGSPIIIGVEEVEDGEFQLSVRERDIPLIAAAPQLLAACEAALSQLHSHATGAASQLSDANGVTAAEQMEDLDCAVCAELESAIAAAEGGGA